MKTTNLNHKTPFINSLQQSKYWNFIACNSRQSYTFNFSPKIMWCVLSCGHLQLLLFTHTSQVTKITLTTHPVQTTQCFLFCNFCVFLCKFLCIWFFIIIFYFMFCTWIPTCLQIIYILNHQKWLQNSQLQIITQTQIGLNPAFTNELVPS
jgi:hypothetical protein